MKVIGNSGNDIIVQLNPSEWKAIGGKLKSAHSWQDACDPDFVPDLLGLVKALRAIESARPDLKRLRASFQTFRRMLTESEEVQMVLDACGVEKVVRDPLEEAPQT